MFGRDRASQALGMALEEVRAGHARVRMIVRADMLNGHGSCHGGLVFALADSAFAFACSSRGVRTVAAGCAIEFLAPAVEGDVLVAEAQERSLRAGRASTTRTSGARAGAGGDVPRPLGGRDAPTTASGLGVTISASGAHADVPTSLEVRMDTWQKYAAELLGTFVLVFGGTTAILASRVTDAPLLVAVALAFGLALLAGLYAFGEVSGGHFNPAVSLAMFLGGRLPSGELVSYWAAQFAGAILASLLLAHRHQSRRRRGYRHVPGIEGTARRSSWRSCSVRSSWPSSSRRA